MKPARFLPIVIALIPAVVTTNLAGKNRGAGIYAVLDKVTFEPGQTSPERVRISGVFVVPAPSASGGYSSPLRGYLYFKIVPGGEEPARRDWEALASVAGTGEIFGFTSYWAPNPRDPGGNPHHVLRVAVHQPGDDAAPDDYPASLDNNGLIRNVTQLQDCERGKR